MKFPRGERIGPSKLTRMLAKNDIARLRWIISTITNSPIFDGPTTEWSKARLQFCNWCIYYDNIYKMFEHPPESIIRNDEKIDAWLKFKAEQQEFKNEETYHTTGYTSDSQPKSAYSHDEVFEVR